MERIDSGETDDSPFSSNLVTPTDDHTLPVIVRPLLPDGIEQRIAVGKASSDYFTTGRTENESIGLDMALVEPTAEIEITKVPAWVSLTHASESLLAEDGV
jgi:hypothetical protein